MWIIENEDDFKKFTNEINNIFDAQILKPTEVAGNKFTTGLTRAFDTIVSSVESAADKLKNMIHGVETISGGATGIDSEPKYNVPAWDEYMESRIHNILIE